MSSAIPNRVWLDLLLLKRKSLISLLLATIDSFHTRVCEIGAIENIFFPSLDLVGINVFSSWNKQQKTFHEFLWIFNEFCYSWWTVLIFLHVVCPGNWGIEILHQLQFVQQESIFITFRAVDKPLVMEVDFHTEAGWGEGRSLHRRKISLYILQLHQLNGEATGFWWLGSVYKSLRINEGKGNEG